MKIAPIVLAVLFVTATLRASEVHYPWKRGIVTLADVDNFPYQWSHPDDPGYTGAPGPEDVDRVYPGHVAGVFDLAAACRLVRRTSCLSTKQRGEQTPMGV